MGDTSRDGQRSGSGAAGLAQVLYGLLSILFMVVTAVSLVNAVTARSLICVDTASAQYPQGDPHCVRNAWAWAAFALAIAVGSTYTVARLDGQRRGQRRRAWWAGIVVGLLIALPGAVILFSPIRTHETGLTQMLPELAGGLLLLAVAGVLIGPLLARGTRHLVREGHPPTPAPSAADGPGRTVGPGG